MKPESQRIPIAELCPFVANGTRGYTWWFDEEEIIFDPIHDLNACEAMEDALPAELWEKYFEWLQSKGRAAGTRATAAQRCEFFLRVHGKWVED